MSETILFAHGLSCGYRDRRVLSGIDLDLKAGEITSLLGPNGSGKSTLLRTLVGLLKPVQGEVILSGKPLSLLRPSEIARSVAYVAQDERIEFAFTAEEIVRMGRSPFAEGYFDSSQDRELAEEAMVEADCIEFRHRFITELSGGERQRVFIARALAQHPKLLLLDEPSAHFDVRHVLALATLLEKVRAKGIAIFTAIHDLNFAQQLEGKAVLLNQGKVQAQGLAADVLASEALDDAYEVKFRRIKSGETFVIVPGLLK